MTVSITYDEDRTLTPPSQFDVTYTVTSTTDIPQEIFLMDATNPGQYERVCIIGDFGYPTAPDPENYMYYRASAFSVSFAEHSAAVAGQAAVQAAIAELTATYQTGTDAWAGSQTITVP